MAASVADLVTHLHSNIDSIHKCIQSLSDTKMHDVEMERLEKEREAQIKLIRQKLDMEAAELARQRQAEEDALAEQRRKDEEILAERRRKEEEEIAARRKREDDERRSRIEEEERGRVERKKKEDTKRQQEADDKMKAAQEQIEKELERLEDEMERRVEEGKKMLLGLDEKRKAINAQIDAALNTPTVFPTIQFKSRAKRASILVNGQNSGVPSQDPVSDATPKVNGMPAEADTVGSKMGKLQRAAIPKSILEEEPYLNKLSPKDQKEQDRAVQQPTQEISNAEDPSEIEDPAIAVDADKAWWGAHHLQSKNLLETESPTHDISSPHSKTAPIREALGEERANETPSNPDATTKRLSVEDPEDVRAREEMAMMNAEIMRAALEAEQKAQSHEDARKADEDAKAREEIAMLNAELMRAAEQEAEETSKANEDAKAREEIALLNAELIRAAKQEAIDHNEDMYNESDFDSETRDTSLDSKYGENEVEDNPIETEKIIPGVYRFSEKSRPSPSFAGDSDFTPPHVYRFSEQNRPRPSFVYHFTEEQRPRPSFDNNATIPITFRFSEESRPRPAFASEDFARGTLKILSGPYSFSEELRPQPVFRDTVNKPSIYRFSEEQRPQPSFIHRFSEGNRPKPSFNIESGMPKLYRFSEEQRPRPVFQGGSPQSSFNKNATSASILPSIFGLHRFSEENRPQPVFSSQADIPRAFMFSEAQRPAPSFIYRFSEENRPKPSFNLTAGTPKIHSFSEQNRPSPLFDEQLRKLRVSSIPNSGKFINEMDEIARGSKIYHFSEENRPRPAFALQNDIPRVYRFSEGQRPRPTFIHRFSEKDRPKPFFDLLESIPQVWRFSEAERPIPSFDKNSANPNISNAVRPIEFDIEEVQMGKCYRFSEDSRPSPTFVKTTSTPKVFRFSEEIRPNPSFLYRFSEIQRPLPYLYETTARYLVYRFSEDDRPKPSFDVGNIMYKPTKSEDRQPSQPSPSTDILNTSLDGVSGIYHFSEASRPKPTFIKGNQNSQIYQFSEEMRPKPSFIHRFSEDERPQPIFIEQAVPPSVYHFAEEDRVRAAFDDERVASILNKDLRTTRPHGEESLTAKPTAAKYVVSEGLPIGKPASETFPRTHDADIFNDYPTQEVEIPARPITPPHHVTQYHVEESPVTVMHADDLFDDDDSSDEAGYQEEVTDHHPRSDSHPNKERPNMPGAFLSYSTQLRSEIARGEDVPYTDTSAFPELHGEDEEEEEEDEHPANVQQDRRSGVFASLVDAIKSDVPLVNRLISSKEEYKSVPVDDHEPYSDEVPKDLILPNQAGTDMEHSDWQPSEHDDESDEEFPPRPSASGLRVRTMTADTVPSFESYAHSDDEESPTTPSDTALSLFVDNPLDSQSTWSPPRGEIPHSELPGFKPQVSPSRADFEQTYPNYITPRASIANMGAIETLQTSESVGAERLPAQRTPVIDTSHAQKFEGSRPYDSPVSAASSPYDGHGLTQEENSPRPASPFETPSRIPRRPTLTNRNSLGRTPVNSPSVPSNQSSFFQKTRSLFEVSSQPTTPPPTVRPRSGIFNVTRTSPSPSRPSSIKSRPSSLIQARTSNATDDLIVPKSLDGNGKPPSPAFTLPTISSEKKRHSQGNGLGTAEKGNPFLDSLSRLVGSGGLENSIHNPARFNEKERLLGEDQY